MKVEIVGREHELARLRELVDETPGLVLLSGRRRVGKTFLLRAAFDSNPRSLFLQAEQQPMAMQLDSLARECTRLLGTGPLHFTAWHQALDFIESQARAAGSLAVVLDEFQYLSATDHALLSTLQRYVDRWQAERVPVLLVLCGSALGFMAALQDSNAPLFGRSIYRPLLAPFDFIQAAEFAAPGAVAEELIERYALLGGTPQYQRWAGARRPSEILAQLILPEGAPLRSDPEYLLRGEQGVRDPGPYFGILEAIAEGHGSSVSIAGRLGISQPLASMHLKRLAELGYLSKLVPVTPGKAQTKRGYWRIDDPYLRFWFRFIPRNRSRLARGQEQAVQQEIESGLSSYVGRVFEDCCRVWLGSSADFGAAALRVGSWWTRTSDVEIDVVACDKRHYLALGACKWSARPVGIDVLDQLKRAQAVLGEPAAEAQLLIFSRCGFTNSLSACAKEHGIGLISAAELFQTGAAVAQ